MGNKIEELASYVQPLIQELLDQARFAGLDPVLIDTGRTPAEQTQKLKLGVSWTNYSKHEPQPPEGKSEAADIAPRSLLATKGWSPDSPLWPKLGAIGKGLGLAWGGDWTHCPKDPSHFEYVRPEHAAEDVANVP